MTHDRIYRMTPPDTATVERTGGAPRPLKHIVYHSPDGFGWGYFGGGPADLALSILAEHFRELRNQTPTWYGSHAHWLARVEKTRAWRFHQYFKRDVVAYYARDEAWLLTSEDIAWWLGQNPWLREVQA